MVELIVFPDTVALLCGVLEDECAVPAGTRVPNPRPATFLRLDRTGGPRQTLVSDAAQVTVESWAASEAAAHDLAQLARAVLHTLPGTVVDGVAVYRVDEVSGPANLPDPLSDQARYSQTFAVHVRGATQGESS